MTKAVLEIGLKSHKSCFHVLAQIGLGSFNSQEGENANFLEDEPHNFFPQPSIIFLQFFLII